LRCVSVETIHGNRLHVSWLHNLALKGSRVKLWRACWWMKKSLNREWKKHNPCFNEWKLIINVYPDEIMRGKKKIKRLYIHIFANLIPFEHINIRLQVDANICQLCFLNGLEHIQPHPICGPTYILSGFE